MEKNFSPGDTAALETGLSILHLAYEEAIADDLPFEHVKAIRIKIRALELQQQSLLESGSNPAQPAR